MRVFGTALIQETLVKRLELAENLPLPCMLEKAFFLIWGSSSTGCSPTPIFATHTPKATFLMSHTWQLMHFFYY